MIVGRFREGRKDEGLGAVVASMRVGEKCLANVPPQFAYGTKGNFSFPHVPPNSTLVYLVELLAMEAPDESVAKGDLTFEGRCEKAERIRLEGNDLYKAGEVEEALSKYIVSLSYITDEMMYQVCCKR